MEVERKEADVGVIVARFQVARLTAAHMDLISTVVKWHKRTIILLGNSPVPNTRRNPLSFEAREKMVRAEFPDVMILPIHDRSSDQAWSAAVDVNLRGVLQHHETAVIYGSRDSFIEHYSGTFPTQKLEPTPALSGSTAREALRVGALQSEDFRAGIIHGAFMRFPTVYPTVDMAVVDHDMRRVALIKKSVGDVTWRFPGGFVDPKDRDFPAAALREAREEVGLGECEVPEYIGSFSVNDWRYRGEMDCIKTTFFLIRQLWGTLKAGDDAAVVEWHDIDHISVDSMCPSHQMLLTSLKEFVKNRNAKRASKRIGVGVVILDETKTKILISKRIGCDKDNGIWGLPGGKMDPDENVATAAIREVREETGMEVKGKVTPLNFVDMNDEVGVWVLAEEVYGTPVNREPEKHGQWEWHPLDNLPANTWVTKETLALINTLK